jgi:hypothetical protein
MATKNRLRPVFCLSDIAFLGAGLPAKAESQAPMMLDLPTSSQASQLPQQMGATTSNVADRADAFANEFAPQFFARHKTCGSWLACEG